MDCEKPEHFTYTFVDDEKEADAIGWVFLEKDNFKKLAFKFPPIEPHEVRAQVTYTGLCHSDVHTVKGEWGPCPYPIVPGHEIIGRVTQVGSNVTDFKVGDKVGFGVQRECCEKCEYCQLGYDQLCNGEVEQIYTYDWKYWGGYATAIQQPAQFFFKIPENLPEEKMPPLLCAGVTTYVPIAKYAKPGQEVAVLGVGGLGHMAVQYAKAWGCKVTAFTSTKDKEELIKKLGADNVVLTDEKSLQNHAGKYHFILNTLSFNGDLTPYVKLTKPLGTFCQVGQPPMGTPGPLDPSAVVSGIITYVGSNFGSRKDIREMLEFSAKHQIVPMCEVYEFNDMPNALDKLMNGKPKFRCVLDVTKACPK